MNAAWFDGERIALKSVPLPEPPPGEALLRLRTAGICNTDIEIARGYMAFTGILGHEFVAEVLKVNGTPEEQAWVGKRVVGEINCPCWECEYCLREDLGSGRHCPKRTVLGIFQRNGCMADRFTLPVRNLLEVPAHVPDEAAVFTEPLAAGCEIMEQLGDLSDKTVAIIGDGKLGLLTAMCLQNRCRRVLVVGKHPERKHLLDSMGLSFVTPDAPADKVWDVTVDAAGNASGIETALKFTRPRGTIVLKSTYEGGLKIDMAPVVVDEIFLVGSRCGRFRPALEMLDSGEVAPQSLIATSYPLEELEAAFEAAMAPGSLKVLLKGPYAQ